MHQKVTEQYNLIISSITQKHRYAVWNIIKIRLFESDAISMRDLAKEIRLTDRAVRRIIETLRNHGITILDSDKGYWLSYNRVDILFWLKRRKTTAQSFLYCVPSMLATLADFDSPQRSLPL